MQRHSYFELGLVPRKPNQLAQDVAAPVEVVERPNSPHERNDPSRAPAGAREVDEFLEDGEARRDTGPAGEEDHGFEFGKVEKPEAAVRSCTASQFGSLAFAKVNEPHRHTFDRAWYRHSRPIVEERTTPFREAAREPARRLDQQSQRPVPTCALENSQPNTSPLLTHG